MSAKKENKNRQHKEANINIGNNAGKIKSAINGETGHFIGGLICLMFGVYLFLAFTSFLSASIPEKGSPKES